MFIKTEEEIKRNWIGDTNKPVVSICCTTYNHKNYIEDAMKSFLMQETDFPFEILIRDDASCDGTTNIIKNYVEKYPNIIKMILEKENTFSKGIKPMPELYKIAQGDYIAICEGDDYWTDSKKLQLQKDFLEENKEYVLAFTSVEAFNEHGIVDDYIGGELRDLSEIQLKMAPAINTLTVMFRNIIDEMPKEFLCTYYGDMFLWSLLGSYGRGKYLENIKPARYRMHTNGLHSLKNNSQKGEALYMTYEALKNYYNRVNDHELAEYFHFKNLISLPFSLLFKILINKIFLKMVSDLHILRIKIMSIYQ
jgi:glycosyltransferase involved in cell wall biosynthesis